MQDTKQNDNSKLISGIAIFEQLKTSFFRVQRNLTEENVEIFNALPIKLLDLLQSNRVVAFNRSANVRYRGVFTGFEPDENLTPDDGDVVTDMYYRVDDLRSVLEGTLEEISPQSLPTLMGEFEYVLSLRPPREERRVSKMNLQPVPGYASNVKRVQYEDCDDAAPRSYKSARFQPA